MNEPERFELREGPAYVFQPTRREFSALLGAGLLVWVQSAEAQEKQPRLHVGDDGRITVLSGKIEEGQGARTELAMAAAEELGVPLEQVQVLLADTDAVPNDGITAGSRTTPATVPEVRQAARAYRKREVLTPVSEWKVLGTPVHRINGRAIVTGEHRFPSDIQRPGMLYGAVLRAPSYGARLLAVDTAAVKTTVVRDGDFAACAAPTSFAARKALDALAATAKWEEKPHPASDTLFEYLKEHAQAAGSSGRNQPLVAGDVAAALAGASRKLQATYTAAYIHHAPMEPRAAVAEWTEGKLTVWTGTSNPFAVRDQLAQAFRIPPQRVRVIVPDMGGGFGGKHTGEAALEAARLAREAGKPVSLRWTRAEEFAWAYARPAARVDIEAALDADGAILAWDFANYNSGASAIDTPYAAAHKRIRYIPSDSPLRQGSYRALASTANNFARECFLDELAASAGQDPLAFRLQHLRNDRIRQVLVAAAQRFGWERRRKQRAPNRGIGLACGTEKNSVVAACVEVEVDPRTGTPRLVEIVQAYECGKILNPAGLKAQVEGCIVMGLAALREELRFAGGKLTNGRFSAYRVPRFRDVPPKMDILLMDRKDAAPVGAGETPIIAVAPAMGSAIFAATGYRPRTMPFGKVPAGRKS